MASTLFVCVKCLGTYRIVGYVPPDFDNICPDCKEDAAEQAIAAQPVTASKSMKVKR